jgi:hypothetical protein
MDLKDFFKNQRVTQAELDAAFVYAENDRKRLLTDNNFYGIMSGFVATLGSAPTVDITNGKAYDKLGRRIPGYSDLAGTKNFSFANATDGTATSVTGGNERWISVYARFGRQANDPRTDGDGNPVRHDQPEALHDNTLGPTGVAGIGGSGVDKPYIVAGVMAATGTAVRPALHADAVLICDIKRTPSDGSNVLDTTRRELGLLQALSTWRGGRTNPAQGLAAAFSKLIDDLGAQTASDDGAERVGFAGVGNLTTGSVASALAELDTEKGGLAVASSWTAKQSFDAATASVAAIGFADVPDSSFRLLWQIGNGLNAKKWRLYACMSTTTIKGLAFTKGSLIFTWNYDLNATAVDVTSVAHSFVAFSENVIKFGSTTVDAGNWQVMTINPVLSSGSNTTLAAGGLYEVGMEGDTTTGSNTGAATSFRVSYDSSGPTTGGVTQDTTFSAQNANSVSVGSITQWGFSWTFVATSPPSHFRKSARVLIN